MTMRTITVDIDDDVLRTARELVGDGDLNEFIAEALKEELRRARARRLALEEVAASPEIPQAVRDEVRRQWLG